MLCNFFKKAKIDEFLQLFFYFLKKKLKICGREFGTKSLAIHIKTCEKMFLVEEEKKLKKDRRPLP